MGRVGRVHGAEVVVRGGLEVGLAAGGENFQRILHQGDGALGVALRAAKLDAGRHGQLGPVRGPRRRLQVRGRLARMAEIPNKKRRRIQDKTKRINKKGFTKNQRKTEETNARKDKTKRKSRKKKQRGRSRLENREGSRARVCKKSK